MEWLEKILNEALKPKYEKAEELKAAVEALQGTINKTLPLHMMPKEEYNSKAAELKATTDKMTDVEKQLKTATENQEDKEKVKADLLKMTNDFNIFKTDAEKRQGETTKLIAVEKHLRKSGAAEDAIELLKPTIKLNEVVLDKDNNIVDWATKFETPYKERYKSSFVITDTKHTGGDGDKKETGESDDIAEIYKKAGMEPFNKPKIKF